MSHIDEPCPSGQRDSTATKTGVAIPGCYAAVLRDCGETREREHFVTEALLARFGDTFRAYGLPWLKADSDGLTPNSLASRVLCGRHNRMLSRFDSTICHLFDLLDAWHLGRDIGWRTINGDDLERWAMKVLFGFAASRNLLRKDRSPVAKATPPEEYLRMLFDDGVVVPVGCGFYFTTNRSHETSNLALSFNTFPDGHPQAGALVGITVRLLDFAFAVRLTPMQIDGSAPDLWYRPLGFILEDKGLLRLEWAHTPSQSVIALKRTTGQRHDT